MKKPDEGLNALVHIVNKAGGPREFSELGRRLMKLGEEYGEALQAYLALTGTNYKQIRPEDLREEMVDVVLVALDVLFYRVPGEEMLSDEKLEQVIMAKLQEKVEKWKKVRALPAPEPTPA